MNRPFFSIGHSTHTVEELVELLRAAAVERVVDIRRIPRSRTNPQFNKDAMPAALAAFDISYEHVAELGGRRGKAGGLPPEINGYWENESFHHYADYAMSAEFRAGFARLLEMGHERRCAMMCSEAVWWRCHRRIVADYLIAAGESVFHIMGRGKAEPARLTPGAVIQADGGVAYPAGPEVES